MPDLIDVLIEAQTELDWCADPSELERALIRRWILSPARTWLCRCSRSLPS